MTIERTWRYLNGLRRTILIGVGTRGWQTAAFLAGDLVRVHGYSVVSMGRHERLVDILVREMGVIGPLGGVFFSWLSVVSMGKHYPPGG